ncbi:MAG: O-antigen ligase family protein, partial [Chloroflexi bacterium]|nr:O-antigen ligase family protein [Chloroflexota bacterium]
MKKLLAIFSLQNVYPIAGLAILAAAGVVWGLGIGTPVTLILLSVLGIIVVFFTAYQQIDFKAIIFLIGFISILIIGIRGTADSYNNAFGTTKLWGLGLAGLIGLAVLLQPKENHVFVRDLLLISAVVAAVVILLTYDWQRFPTDFNFVNQIGLTINRLFPIAKSEYRIDDTLGGICVAVMPAFYTEFVSRVERKQKRFTFLFLLAIFFLLFTVLLTGTRSLWIGIVIGAIAYGAGHFLFHEDKRAAAFIVGGSSLLLFVCMLWLADPGGKVSQFLSGVDYRFELISDSGWLIPDFWLFGGGAGSYPGLFSRYILNESHFYIAHSHNLLSDLSIELGIISTSIIIFLLTLPILIFLSNYRQMNFSRFSAENASVFATFIFILLLDDPFWGGGSIPFLFVPLTFLLKDHLGQSRVHFARTSITAMITLAAIFLFNFVLFNRGISIPAYHAHKAYANLELAGFPNNITGFYDELEKEDSIISGYVEMNKEKDAPSINYRLGLHYLREKDFVLAANYLEKAYLAIPEHPGYRENYAFSLVLE